LEKTKGEGRKLKKVVSLTIVALLTLSILTFIPIPIKAAPAEFRMVNPGPDGYPDKWTAGSIRGVGTSDFIFYANETDTGDTFIMNVTVIDAQDMKGWGIGIIFNHELLEYVAAWRPPDHVFKPVEDMGWTLVAPPVVVDTVDATHSIIKWGCTYIMGTPEWSFSGSGVLCQIQFRIKASVDRVNDLVEDYLTFDPDWTVINLYPSGTEIPALGTAHFLYQWFAPTVLPQFYVKPSTVEGKAIGEDVVFEVWVKNVEAAWSIVGFQFSLWFNTSCLEATSFEVGDWMNNFINNGESIVYRAYADFHGDPELPYCYNKWMAFIMIIPGDGNQYWAPFPSGEGMLFRFHFTAKCETLFPIQPDVWTELELHDMMVLDKFNLEVDTAPPINGWYRCPRKVMGLQIDVYTQYTDPYGGQGFNKTSDMFGPQALVQLYAEVTYNGDPVQQKLVGFEIRHGEFYIYRENYTDVNGVAWINFRIPWPCDDPEGRVFGEWTVYATVEVAEKIKVDTLKFLVWWPIEIVSVTPKELAYIKMKDNLPTMEFEVEYRTYSMQPLNAVLTVTVYDELGFFLGHDVYTLTNFGWGEYDHYGEFFTGSHTFAITMPSYAMVGPNAKVYANAFTKVPWEGGVPYCPEVSATFKIEKA